MFFRDQIVGKYKILSTIGSGGFGTVYLAEDTWIDKKVALKVPHKQGVDFGELLREPRLLATLNHPNIVTIVTAEKQDNVFFIVMELVSGETLEAIIAREGALDVPLALDYTCQICNAVDYAHRQGVLHRDLRPSNVLVSDNGLVKVADFGSSRFLEIAAYGTTVIGSPPYMAPDIHARYQRAGDILQDLLAARGGPRRATAGGLENASDESQEIQARLKAREAPLPRFCWHCRKPLHARSDRCPFCGETQ